MELVLAEKPIVISANVAILGFDAKKVDTQDDYHSILDSAKVQKQDVIKLGYLQKHNPRKFRHIVYEKLVPRGLLASDLRFKQNKAVDDGLEQINKLMRGASVAAFAYNGVGDDATAPGAGQADLISLIERIAIGDRYPEGKTINHWDTWWSSALGNDGGTATWKESDLNTAASGGVMGFRLIFADFEKNNTKSANIAWTTTLASLT